ncbi:MAG: extracellular solute-binding protein, partial [Oscillospiraceae bacterium]|nr:extracellular solute-binding protein [Oscillospiraceae bacterium]
MLSLLLILSLAACAVQPGEDYAEFVPPEETDTLVLYENPLLSDLIDRALTLFKRKYPDVNVEYRRYSFAQYDEMTTTLNAELAAGEGPDIFWDYSFNYDFSKVKSMENGVYTDLEPFFAWDDEIDLADYNEAALNAGMYMGHRYMVPLYFETMVWVTTQEVLDEAGLNIQG